MTMHMLPVYYTTTNYKKRKKNKKTASLLAAEKKHDAWLMKMGVHKSQRKTIVRKDNTYNPSVDLNTRNVPECSNNIGGQAIKKAANSYSGERKLLGIATMHKSNLVPVFEKSDAKELAKMRRG